MLGIVFRVLDSGRILAVLPFLSLSVLNLHKTRWKSDNDDIISGPAGQPGNVRGKAPPAATQGPGLTVATVAFAMYLVGKRAA